MEPDYFITNMFSVLVPFICYYFGIIIRKVAMPGKNSPQMSHQLLLGIPISLIVVSPMLPILKSALSDIPAMLVTLGIIMEHGMILNETATNHIKKIVGKAA